MDDEVKALVEKMWDIVGHSPDDGMDFLDKDRKLEELIITHDSITRAKALREAAAQFRDAENPLECGDTWGWHTKDYERAVLALIPQLAPKLYTEAEVSEARLEEAKKWSHNWFGDGGMWDEQHRRNCRDCRRVDELRAAVKGRE